MDPAEEILVVDDDPGITGLLAEHLEGEGHRVLVAHSAAEGIRFIDERPVALVLLDLVLPDGDGLAVMHAARRRELPPEVVIVTGHASLDSAIQAVEGSAAGYIVKPVDLNRLAAIVRRVVERRHLLRENAALQRDLSGRVAESEALAAVSATVSSTLDVREGLRRICRELARLLGAETAAAYLHDRATDDLVPAAAYHVPKEYVQTLAVASLPLREQGFHLPIWGERRPVFSDDVAHDPRFTHALFRAFPHQSGLLLPIILDTATAGAFYLVWWKARRSPTGRELQLAQRVCDQVGLLLKNARLFENAERNRRQLEVLNEVSRRLAAVHEPDEVLGLIVNEAARLLGAEAAGIRLREGDDLLVAARTESAARVMARPRIKVGESLSGRVVATGETVVVEDLSADTGHDPLHKRGALELGFRGFVGVPLRSRGGVTGTLNIYTKGVRRFDADEIALLSGLADQAAVAIEKARLFRDTEEGQQRLERLYRAAMSMQTSWDRDARLDAFIRAAHDVVGFDRVRVLLLTADGTRLEPVRTLGPEAPEGEVGLPFSPDAGPFWQAMQRRRAVAVLSDEDLARAAAIAPALRAHPDLRSRRFVVAPLVIGDRVIGAASADNKPSRRPIAAASVEPFGMLCQDLAMALEESRLYAEAQARERQATRLHGLTRELATSLEADQVLDRVTAQTVELLGCDAAAIFGYDGARGGLTYQRGLNLEPELTRAQFLRPGEGVAGRAFQERRVVWTRDVRADASLEFSPVSRRLVGGSAMRAVLGVPIASRDEVHGVLMAYFFVPKDFSPDAVKLVETLADHSAIALQNARLFEETRAREREAKTLSDGLALLNQASRALHRTLEVDKMLTGALDDLAKAFGASGAVVNIFDAAGTQQRSVGYWLPGVEGRAHPARKHGISQAVRTARAPMLIADIGARRDIVHPENFVRGVKAIAAFPIVGQGAHVLGALLLYYTTTQKFPDGEVRLLASYADQLGTALENAQLYEQTQTQQVRLAQIFDSTSDGIILVSREGEIRAANRRAGALLDFDAGEVLGVSLTALLAGFRSSVPDHDRTFGALQALLGDPERGGAGDLDLTRGSRVVHWTGQPTRDATGATIGFTLTLRDVTEERQVSQMKSDFVSFVTHQLRTPLAGIKWMLELAAQAPDAPGEAAGYVQDAREAAERLIGLVNDLLDISRLESGKLTVNLEPTDLGALTAGVLGEIAPLLEGKRHRLSVTGTEALPPVLADVQLLRQVVLNLTSNAIKYTPTGGQIAIRMRAEDGAVRWEIRDSGIGVPGASQARLFEKFFRAENAHTVETEGTGLGLYLVRLIVEKLGGRVWCESEEGKGATFIFTLPADR